MTPEQSWADVADIVADALELHPDARVARLASCAEDPARHRKAIRLLRCCELAEASPLLGAPAAALAAPVLAVVEDLERVGPETLRAALADRYTIERELGRGGQAVVYLARDERHGRLVALKVVHAPALPNDEPSRVAARFRREIRFAASLSHPHIVPLYDSGAAAGRLFYIAPFVDGESLRDRIARDGRIPLGDALRIVRDVARALAHAHRRGVVHRDIKPANILLNQEGDALVSDFGVAKAIAAVRPDDALREPAADAAFVLGTAAYMAPEQAGADPSVDHRADLYALGIVAYELLTGATPFAGRGRHALLAAHGAEMPEPVAAREPAVPPAVAALVDRLLAKRPSERPPNANAVLRVLDEAMTSERHAPARRDPDAPPGRAAERGTDNADAYRLFQKGWFLYNTRQRDAMVAALRLFEQAVALDPAYARAHAARAGVELMLGTLGYARPDDVYPRARAAAERAVALDDTVAEGHAVLAHLLFVYDWNWSAAGRMFERALALAPRQMTARMYYASYLHSVGRSDDSLAELQAARDADPLTPTGLLSGRVYVDTGRPDAAIPLLIEEIDMDPRRDLAHQLLAHAYVQQQMPGAAIASMRRAAALSGARDTAQLAYVHAATGDRATARRIVRRLRREAGDLDYLGFHLAMAYAGLGDTDEALRWLEAAYATHGAFMNLLGVSAGFESLRADPRFADLLARMGLDAAHARRISGPR